MDVKEDLTNEKVGKKFSNQFEAVNFAIAIAERKIKSGHEVNGAAEVINEVLSGRKVEDIEVIKVYIEEEISPVPKVAPPPVVKEEGRRFRRAVAAE